MNLVAITMIYSGMLGFSSDCAAPYQDECCIPQQITCAAETICEPEFIPCPPADEFYSEVSCCPEAAAECCGDTSCCTSCCDECDGLFYRLFGPAYCGAQLYPNMPPHYPYQTPYSGYYYFRPYNYTNIPIQQEQAVEMGFSRYAPYASGGLDDIYRSLESDYDTVAPRRSGLRPLTPPLPNLQTILNTP